MASTRVCANRVLRAACHGRITKRGRGHARGMLVEAARRGSAGTRSRPVRSSCESRARRGQHVAAVATRPWPLQCSSACLLPQARRRSADVEPGRRCMRRRLRDLELGARYRAARGQRAAAHAYVIENHVAVKGASGSSKPRRLTLASSPVGIRVVPSGCARSRNRGATMKAVRGRSLRLAPCSSPRSPLHAREESRAGHARKYLSITSVVHGCLGFVSGDRCCSGRRRIRRRAPDGLPGLQGGLDVRGRRARICLAVVKWVPLSVRTVWTL